MSRFGPEFPTRMGIFKIHGIDSGGGRSVTKGRLWTILRGNNHAQNKYRTPRSLTLHVFLLFTYSLIP
jgi:hypothetical protein